MSESKPQTLVLLAAALGWNLIEKHKPATKIAFRPLAPGPLALACPAQAALRTALPPFNAEIARTTAPAAVIV